MLIDRQTTDGGPTMRVGPGDEAHAATGDEVRRRSAPACGRRLGRRIVGACLLVLLCALPAWGAEEPQPESSEEILKKIEELAEQPVTDAQIAEMDELLARFEAAVEREKKAKKQSEQKDKRAPKASPKPKPAVKPSTMTPPKGKVKATPKPTSRRRASSKKPAASGKAAGKSRGSSKRGRPSGRKGKRRKSVKEVPVKQGVELEPELNVDAERYLKPFDQREYSFSIKDGTYANLIESFARMASLAVIGKAPDGTVSFVSSESMDFKTALGRVRMLLFNHPDQYWMLLQENKYLAIKRVTEIKRILELDLIFPTLAEYRAANLDDNELALLLYTPESGSIADLEPLRDYMPDYVRIAQHADQNAMTVFGLVRDIEKYLQLIAKFQVGITDPREFKVIPVQHILPSEALATVQEFVPGFGAKPGVSAKRRKSGERSIANAQARGWNAIANDEMKTLLVLALPKKIEEIERFLTYIDVPLPGTDHAPVVVRLQHAAAADVISLVSSLMAAGHEGTSARTTRSKKRPRRRKARKSAPAAAVSAAMKDLTMLEWAPANSILLIGTEEKVAQAKKLIERFDVPAEQETKIVSLEHREASELASLVTQLLKNVTHDLHCSPDPGGGAIVLAGPVNEVTRAEAIIATLDVKTDDAEAGIHSIRLHNTTPSGLIGILNMWESGAALAKPAGKRKKRAPRRSRPGNKFDADDDSGLLYVVCTDEEWTEKYKPLIEKLDADLADSDYAVISLEYLDPGEAIASLQTFFGGAKRRKGGKAPIYLDVPDGVMVMNATPAQIATMRHVLAELDVDRLAIGVEQRRTFILQHKEPGEVITVVKAVIGGAGATGSKAKGSKAPISTVRFAELGNKIWVIAPSRKMEEIAALIKELDVPDAEREIRFYEFAIGTNVGELSKTLSRFFPPSRSVTLARPRRGKAPPSKPKKTTTAAGGILFVPQPETRKIFVSAPREKFEEIEETIEMLRPDVKDRPGLAYEFFDVGKGDPALIADLVEPIMSLRLDELIASGEVPEPDGKKKSALRFIPDLAAKRLVVAAPKVLMPEIATLIDEVEQGDFGEKVVRVVKLVNSTADEMASTINGMLSGKRTAPAARTVKGRGRRAASKKVTARMPGGVTCVAVPGGTSLVLNGPAKEVDEVESWIRLLDEDATATRVMKVYHPIAVDVETLADQIMTILDSAPPGRGKPKRAGDLLEDDFFDLGGPRRGTEISLTTNYFTNTMIVWASPRKLAMIDELVEKYEQGEVEDVEDLPSMIYELKYADAYDAVWDLEEFIDALWTKDKPTVDYLPFQNAVVVKSRNPDDFKRIEDIIHHYIDKESEGDKTAIKTKAIKGAQVDLVAKMIMSRLDDVDIEVVGLEIDNAPTLLKVLRPELKEATELAPCVLPAMLVRAMESLAAAETGQQVTDGAGGDEPADADPLARLLRAKEAQKERPKQKLRMVIDPQTNSITFEGPPKAVADAEYALKKIQEELEEMPQRPDIRVYELKHVDPNVAAEVLQAMFGAGAPARQRALTPQQRARQQRQMQQQMQKMQQDMQKAIRKIQQGQGVEETKGGSKRGRGKDEEEGKSAGKQAASGIQVFPYPSLHAIIVKAPTELYPGIVELVATIDRKTDPTTDFRFFPIKNQLASDVELTLKIIFGLQQREQQRRARPRGRRQNAAADAVQELIRQQLNLPLAGMEGSETLSSTESITITSNNLTNTVLMRAPQRVLEMTEGIIAKIEANAPSPKVTVTYPLVYADATVVVPHLEKLFASSAGRSAPRRPGVGQPGVSGQRPDDVQAVFIADTLNNAIIVRAEEDDLVKIETVIKKIDVQSGPEERVLSMEIVHGDAVQMAKTLESIYGMGRRGRLRGQQSAKRIQFVGDASSNTIFVSAPPELREEIATRVRDMDAAAGQKVKPKFIALKAAPATVVARTIEEAFGIERRRGKSSIKITGDDTTKRLMVICPDEMFPQVEKLAHELDVAPDIMDIRVFPLQYARAPEVLQQMERMVQKLLQQIRGKNIQLDPFSASADERSNSLVVMGGPITFALVERVLKQIDVETAAPLARETLVIALTKTRANEVARLINRLFRDRKDGIDPPRAEANNSTNTLLVNGTGAQLEEIRAKIGELEGLADGAEPVRRIYAMKEARASNVANIVNQTLRQTRRQGGMTPLTVVPDDEMNVIIVAGTQKDYEEIVPLLEQLDKQPAEQGLTIRVYPVNYADPNSLIGTINNSFPRLRGQRPEDMVKASYTWGTSSLVVSASEENHAKVKDLLGQIDVESSVERTTHVIALKEGNAEDLANRLNDILRRTQRRRRDDQGMAIVADPGTNSLLVFANDAELARVRDLVNTLDVPPAFDRDIRSFKLVYAEAGPTREAIVQLFGRRTGRRVNPREEVAVVVDWATNSVIVSAAPAKMSEINRFINEIDQVVTGGREVHVVTLKYADPQGVLRSLQDMFVKRSRRGEQTISVSAPQGTDALLIRANAKEFEEIAAVIEQLDALPADEDRRARMFTLKYTDAGEMQTIVEDYLRKPGGTGRRSRGRDQDLVGNIRITTILSSNSLVVTGDEDGLERVAALVAQIDVEVEDAGTAPRIIRLERGIASDIEPILTQIFVEGARGGRGRGRSASITPVIIANDAANSLIVRASPTDYNLIARLALSLDQEERDPAARIRLIQLASAFKAADLAPTIEATLRGSVPPSGRGARRGAEVSVEPILASNSLLIAGDPKQLAVAEAVIAQIQAQGPRGDISTIILRPDNISPDEFKRVIDEMIGDNKSQGPRGTRRRGRRR